MRLLPFTSGKTLPREFPGTWQVATYLTLDGDQGETDDLWLIEPERICCPEKDLEITSIVMDQDWDKESYLLSFADSPVQYLLGRSERYPDQLYVRAYLEGQERLRFLLTKVTVEAPVVEYAA
jgi:hypothetical protein